MRQWRENGCWSNDAGITSSLLSLRPFMSPSLSRSPSVSSLCLSTSLSFFVCLSSFTSFHHHLCSRDKAESKKSLRDVHVPPPSFFFFFTKTTEQLFVVHDHWMVSPSVETRNEERHETTAKSRKTNTKWCKTIRVKCKRPQEKEKMQLDNKEMKRAGNSHQDNSQ